MIQDYKKISKIFQIILSDFCGTSRIRGDRNMLKRIISLLTAVFMVLPLIAVPGYANEVTKLSADNISYGMYQLAVHSEHAEVATVEEKKSGTGDYTEGLKFTFLDHTGKRKKLFTYLDPQGTEAKFVHIRLKLAAIASKSPSLAGVDRANGFRWSHYKSDEYDTLRINTDIVPSSVISIYHNDDISRGFAYLEEGELVWGNQEVKTDVIFDCENGDMLLFYNDKLAAIATDAARDGKFYGFDIGIYEDGWDRDDIFSVAFDPERPGHRIYKDTETYKVTLDDVLKDAGLSTFAVSQSVRKTMETASTLIAQGGAWVHKQKEIFHVTGTGMTIEADLCDYSSNYTLGMDRNAADLKMLKGSGGVKDTPVAGSLADLRLRFTVDTASYYNVWVRTFASSASNDSFHFSFGEDGEDNNFSQSPSMSTGAYTWIRLARRQLTPGVVYTLRLRVREDNNIIDNFLITPMVTTPSGRYGNIPEVMPTEASRMPVGKYEIPKITPPKGEHPRVLFTKKDIPKIRENMSHPQNAAVMAKIQEFLSMDELPGLRSSPDSFPASDMHMIEAFAFDYVINGNREHGMDAKKTILRQMEYVSMDNASSDNKYRQGGMMLYTAAKVYDWCYDLFTKAERDKLLLLCQKFGGTMEVGWPPIGQGVVSGHGAESQILRDYLALAIAVYDERPDLWNLVGGRYFEEYVPARQMLQTSLHQGSDYGIYREMWSLYSYALMKGMGAEYPIDPEIINHANLWMLYLRRPDGQIIRDGDISAIDRQQMWEYVSFFMPRPLTLLSYITGNPYYKLERARTAKDFNDWSNAEIYQSPVENIIFNDPTLEPAKTFEDLPLSYYLGSPNGYMVARTGWNDGVDSPDVIATMKIGEWMTNGHRHLDAGHFQIYYKGILASDSGVYQGAQNNTQTNGTAYGSVHFNQYQTKTIAHNCMLVYDPSEANPSSTSRNAINDGGQRFPKNTSAEPVNIDVMLKDGDEWQVAKVDGVEIDPQNPKKPAYSYLKGDLTNAYSDKVTDYKRSFMFLNLDNEEVPAALIVFDKIDSSNASFKKTWLLHGIEEPVINGTRTIFSRTYKSSLKGHAYNGKLTVDTLLPVNSKFDKVGGDGAWAMVNGKNYPGTKLNTELDEGYTWRLEISPSVASKSDYFLNVLQVSDNDKDYYLPVEMVESKDFYGAKISDRVVAFSKSGEKVKGGFTLSIGGSGEYQYTICDVEAGSYSVNAGGKTLTATVTEEGGVLSFTAPAGTVSVTKTGEIGEVSRSANQLISEIVPSDTDKVCVRIDDEFVYVPGSAKMVKDTIMINPDILPKYLGAEMKKEGEILTVSNRFGSVTFTAGSSNAMVNGETKELSQAAYVENGIWYVPVDLVIEVLNGQTEWNPLSNTVFITRPPRDLSLPEGYARIEKVTPDDGDVDGNNVAGNIIDENTSTIWSAQGVGRYVTMTLEKASTIRGIEIIFNPNQGRNAKFAVEVSEDGVNFREVYTGAGDGSVDPGTWEYFEFEKPQSNIKYVRYIGLGSNISTWNAVQEIRIKKD